MERQKHKGSFLLVEGSSDIKRLSGCVDESVCSYVNCAGKDNVVGAVELLYDDGILGVVGLIDADFDRIVGATVAQEGVVVSDGHDFDLDAALTPAIERYCGEVCDKAKLDASGGVHAVVQDLLAGLKPLSCLRLANQKYGLRYSLSDLRHDEFFDGSRIDIDRLVDHVSAGRFNTAEARARIRKLIDTLANEELDLVQLTCGHDFCAALGIALRSRLGSRRPTQTWRTEIEMHLRLAYSLLDMAMTKAHKILREWEAAQAGRYRVLLPLPA